MEHRRIGTIDHPHPPSGSSPSSLRQSTLRLPELHNSPRQSSIPTGYLSTSPPPPNTRPTRVSPRQGGAVTERRRGEASVANTAKADGQKTTLASFDRQPAELLNETQPKETVGAFLRRSYSTLLADETGVPIDIMQEALAEEGRDESDKPKVLSAAQRIFNSRLHAGGSVTTRFKRRQSVSPTSLGGSLTQRKQLLVVSADEKMASLCRSYSTLLANEAGVPIDIMQEALVEEGRDESDKPKVLSAAQRIYSSRHGGWGEASVASVANGRSKRRSSVSTGEAGQADLYSTILNEVHRPKPPAAARSRRRSSVVRRPSPRTATNVEDSEPCDANWTTVPGKSGSVKRFIEPNDLWNKTTGVSRDKSDGRSRRRSSKVAGQRKHAILSAIKLNAEHRTSVGSIGGRTMGNTISKLDMINLREYFDQIDVDKTDGIDMDEYCTHVKLTAPALLQTAPKMFNMMSENTGFVNFVQFAMASFPLVSKEKIIQLLSTYFPESEEPERVRRTAYERLTEEEEEELMAIAKSWDDNRNNLIDKNELRRHCRDLMDDDEIDQLFVEYDVGNKGELTFDEVAKCFASVYSKDDE